VVDAEAEVEEAVRRAHVELHALEDGRDVVAREPERSLDAARVDRARPHPLLDGNVAHRLGAVAGEHLGNPRTILEMRRELVLAREDGERGPGEAAQIEGRIERAAIVVHPRPGGYFPIRANASRSKTDSSMGARWRNREFGVVLMPATVARFSFTA